MIRLAESDSQRPCGPSHLQENRLVSERQKLKMDLSYHNVDRNIIIPTENLYYKLGTKFKMK